MTTRSDDQDDKPDPLLAVVMIVKNEAHAIARTLESVRRVVDRYEIVDTGSTDGTCQVFSRFLQSVPDEEMLAVTREGETFADLSASTFENFAQARNESLDICLRVTGAKWALVLSADEVLEGGDALRRFLKTYDGPETALLVDLVTDGGRSVAPSPRVVKLGSPWRFEGVVHELLVNREEEKDPTVSVPGVRVVHAATDPERRLARMRDFDVPAMERALKDAATGDFWRRRYTLMLAQTCESIADADAEPVTKAQQFFAALGLYRQRVEMGGPDNEVHYAHFHYLRLAQYLGVYTATEIYDRLMKLVEVDPKRPEARLLLAMVGAESRGARAGLTLALEAAHAAERAKGLSRTTPVDPNVHWRSLDLAAQCARALGEKKRTEDLARRAVAAGAPKERYEGVI